MSEATDEKTEDGRAAETAKPVRPVPGPLGKTIIDDAAMVLLALISILLLVFELHAAHTPEQMRALEVADSAIAFIFLIEFSVRFIRAEDRKTFVRRHWWELLASIPINSVTTQALRALNLLRVFRLIRLLRLLRFLVRLKILLQASARFAEHTYIVYVAALSSMVIMSGTLGFHYLEAGLNPNVKSLWDSFWWTIVTVTTVGYGDIFPVTTGGRILAIMLMLVGIATFSAVTAVIAAYLVEQKDKS